MRKGGGSTHGFGARERSVLVVAPAVERLEREHSIRRHVGPVLLEERVEVRFVGEEVDW
jgi:hypothetical protein